MDCWINKHYIFFHFRMRKKVIILILLIKQNYRLEKDLRKIFETYNFNKNRTQMERINSESHLNQVPISHAF